VNIRHKAFRSLIAAFALALGIASTKTAFLTFTSIISLLFLFGVPLAIIIIATHHGVILKSECRPFIGKAFHAVFLWLLPSVIVAFLNLIYWVESTDSEILYRHEPTIPAQMIGNLIIFVLTIVYCLAGIGLCLWVKRDKISDHWLLRNK
jgi:hypothetical protein